MSRHKENILVVDVETAGSFAGPKVYDIGLAVVERTSGTILEAHSFIVPEVYYGKPEDMASAYYADKRPMYDEGILVGDWVILPFLGIRGLVARLCLGYRIRRAYAYNMAFDLRALNFTTAGVSNGRYERFFPSDVEACDIWTAACTTIMRQKGYRKFCEAHGFVSEKGNLQTTAEVCFAYMMSDPTFAEEHTGLADVIIETAILHHAISQHKPMCEKIMRNPWKIPQERTDAML